MGAGRQAVVFLKEIHYLGLGICPFQTYENQAFFSTDRTIVLLRCQLLEISRGNDNACG